MKGFKNMKKVLITGSTGFLGSELVKLLQKKYIVYGNSRTAVKKNNFKADLVKINDVKKIKENLNPDVIVHAAGIKDIKKCEDNIEYAKSLNATTVKNICKVFSNTKIIYISTDYVFSGSEGLYKEEDSPSPITNYGISKMLGEEVGMKLSPDFFKIIRTASIYCHNSSFIKFLDNMIKKDEKFESYTDCIFSPTSIYDLSMAIMTLIDKEFDNDVFHVAGKPISRYEFAKSYYELKNANQDNIIKSKNIDNKYLFKNLSLCTKKTSRMLDLKITSIKDSLNKTFSIEA